MEMYLSLSVDRKVHIKMESAIPEKTTFAARLKSLLMVDCIRLSRLLETCQYACLYSLLCLPIGVGIDRMFAGLYPVVKEGNGYNRRQVRRAILACMLQVMFDAVAIFYIRKIVYLLPFMFDICPSKYVSHYHVNEVIGEAAIALIFVGVQTNLIESLDKLRKASWFSA